MNDPHTPSKNSQTGRGPSRTRPMTREDSRKAGARFSPLDGIPLSRSEQQETVKLADRLVKLQEQIKKQKPFQRVAVLGQP